MTKSGRVPVVLVDIARVDKNIQEHAMLLPSRAQESNVDRLSGHCLVPPIDKAMQANMMLKFPWGSLIPRRGASWSKGSYKISGRAHLIAAGEQELNW